jgi:hypothetical protein
MYISDMKEYVQQQLDKGVTPQLYAKTARIEAREGVVGEVVVTKMKDGHEETKNTVKEKGDMIVRNPNGEEYIIDAKTFAKKYEKDPTNDKQYRPKGGAQSFISVKEDIEFKAPWGEEMSIKAGGMLNISGKDTGDIYGIQKQEFHQTYAPCDENGNIKKQDFNSFLTGCLLKKGCLR